MQGQRELVRVQEPIAVDVRQFPDLAEHRVGQFRFDEFLLGSCKWRRMGLVFSIFALSYNKLTCTGYLAIDWSQPIEDAICARLVLVADPLVLSVAGIDALALHVAEW